MISASLYTLTGVALFALGLVALLLQRSDFRRILSINVMGVGVFSVLIAAAYDPSGNADPVPQALVITGIVVAISATALALVLLRAVEERERDPE